MKNSTRSTRRILATSTFGLFLAYGGMSHAESGTPKTRIYGGEPAKTCEWPSSVHLRVCTGTLVHPRIVLYAAHCGRLSSVMFGENAKTAQGKTVKPKYCKINPAYKGLTHGTDFAYCLLDEPINDVPIAPIAYGCELEQIKANADIWIVGFGSIEDGSHGTKHKGKSRIRKLTTNDKEILIGGDDVATTCYGDSGGPAFIQLSDGTWRTIGIVSYGTNKSCEYPSGLTLANVAVPWIEKDLKASGIDDIDITPCYDEQGEWAPTDACTKFPLAHGESTATWDSMCSEGAKLSGPSTICAPEDKEAPKLDWSGIEDGDSFEEGKDISVKIEAEDNSGVPVKVTLTAGDKELEAIEKPPYEWTIEDTEAGELELSAVGVDAAGNETELEAITVEIEAGEQSTTSEDDSSSAPQEDEDEEDEGKGDDEKDEDSSGEDSDNKDDEDDEDDGGDKDEEDESSDKDKKAKDKKALSRVNSCALAGGPTPTTPLSWLALAVFGISAAGSRRRFYR